MRNVFITTVAAMAISTAAFAEGTTPTAGPVISGELSLDFAEANDKIGGTMGLDLGVDVSGLATLDLDMSATDGSSLTLDNWTVGTTVGALGVAIGDDNGVMPGAEGEQTLAAPAMTESVQVTAGAATVALGERGRRREGASEEVNASVLQGPKRAQWTQNKSVTNKSTAVVVAATRNSNRERSFRRTC